MAELKKEVLKSSTTSSQSTVSQIHELLSKNGTVDIHALSGMHRLQIQRVECSDRVIKRDHRPMALFQEPPPDLHNINSSEEAPTIPNRILYYVAVLMTDPQVAELILTMRVCEDSQSLIHRICSTSMCRNWICRSSIATVGSERGE